MQRFISRAAFERAAAEAFTGARARYYLMGLLALAVASAADFSFAAIWLGAALLVEAAGKALAARLQALSPAQAKAARLGLDTASSATIAAAPAIAWLAPGAPGPALAAVMLCLLLSHAAFNAQHGRLHTALSCAPYAVLTLLFMLDAERAGVLGALAACLACIAYVAAAAMHHAYCASHARLQDAEWVRQLNMTYGEGVAAWEIDYARGKLFGAERLGALLGRPVNYEDIIERGCFAAAADRALVKAAFSPERGAPHRIAIEHAAARPDGSRMRLRHQGFVRTTPDGQPVRLTCVTRFSDSVAEAPAAPRRSDIRAALTSQSEALKTLSNELSTPIEVEADTSLAALSGDLAAALRALALRGGAVERGAPGVAQKHTG